MKCARFKGVSLVDDEPAPGPPPAEEDEDEAEGRTALGAEGRSLENVDNEKKPRDAGGGGFLRIGLPGRIIGIAEDDGEGDVGERGEGGTGIGEGDAMLLLNRQTQLWSPSGQCRRRCQ